jgi:hypothetical protein
MRNLRWGWILLAGFLGELTALLVLFGIRLLHGFSPFELRPLSPIGTAAFDLALFCVPALFGHWVARKAPSQPVLNGLLVGVAAVLIYEALVFRQPIPRGVSYFVAHALKIAGGVVGGWSVARQRRQNRSAQVVVSP